MACVSVSEGSINTDKLNSISWLAFVDQIIIQYNVYSSWQLSRRCALGHLLYRDLLVISVCGVSILCDQWVALFVLLGINTRGAGSTRSHSLIFIFSENECLFLLAVMYTLNDLRSDKRHSCDNSLERDHMVEVI